MVLHRQAAATLSTTACKPRLGVSRLLYDIHDAKQIDCNIVNELDSSQDVALILDEGEGLSLQSVTIRVHQPARRRRMLGELLHQTRRGLSSTSSDLPSSISSVDVPAGGTVALKATFKVRVCCPARRNNNTVLGVTPHRLGLGLGPIWRY